MTARTVLINSLLIAAMFLTFEWGRSIARRVK